MKKLVVVIFLLLNGLLYSQVNIDLPDFPYDSVYDSYYNEMDKVNLKSFILDVLSNNNYVDKENNLLLYSTIKKAGEIRLEEAYPYIRNFIRSYNPMVDNLSGVDLATSRPVWISSVWTIGRIGKDEDIVYLGQYYGQVKDIESKYYIIYALGEAVNSENALKLLNEIADETSVVADTRLAVRLIKSIRNHNSKSSVYALSTLKDLMKNNKNYTKEIETLINKTIEEIGMTGKD